MASTDRPTAAPHPADVIVIGSGVAALAAALAAVDGGARVLLLTAGPLRAGSSRRAQGDVAAAVGGDDRPALHARDTIAVGGGINDRGAVFARVEDGPRVMRSDRRRGCLPALERVA